jgi:uncharacterized protein (TIGR03435 family)
VKRDVWRRDEGQCAFVGRNGRCTERGFLEFHHVQPFAAGGAATSANIQLRCRAHNAYEASLFFGSEVGQRVREARPAYRGTNQASGNRGRAGSQSWISSLCNRAGRTVSNRFVMSTIGSRTLVTAAALVLSVSVFGAAQREVDPAFDVVSVKANVTVNPMASIQLPPGGVNAINVPPYLLIRYAFGLPDSRIVDVPEWAKRTRFDVLARAPATAANEDVRPMVQTLLRDRFKLVTRLETRPAQVHVLTRDVDRPLGPRLTRANGTCAQAAAVNKSGALSSDERCGLSIAYGRVRGGEVSLSELATGLATLAGSVVIDRTGLSGLYTFTLEYTPDAVALDRTAPKEFPNIDPDGPSLATALRDQLGLRWTTETSPVEVLVVVQLEQPDPD